MSKTTTDKPPTLREACEAFLATSTVRLAMARLGKGSDSDITSAAKLAIAALAAPDNTPSMWGALMVIDNDVAAWADGKMDMDPDDLLVVIGHAAHAAVTAPVPDVEQQLDKLLQLVRSYRKAYPNDPHLDVAADEAIAACAD